MGHSGSGPPLKRHLSVRLLDDILCEVIIQLQQHTKPNSEHHALSCVVPMQRCMPAGLCGAPTAESQWPH